MPSPSRSHGLRFAVVQLGARLHYAVPSVLQRAGMLARFYTDIVGDRGVARVVSRLVPTRARPKPVRRWLGRTVPASIPGHALSSLPGWALVDRLVSPLAGRVGLPRVALHERLRGKVLREDFGGATALYCLDNTDLALMREARARGLFIVYEQIINPDVGRILSEERGRFPGLEPPTPTAEVEAGIRRDLEAWEVADLVVVASDFVKERMISLGARGDRIEVVPYGIEEEWLLTENRAEPGRVLFVGSVGLRKGSHYLAEATRDLRARGIPVDVRVVGPHRPGLPELPTFAGPTYVGQVPRAQVRREFGLADLFVLPTLSESFGLVHLEALACGLPVITTASCGSVVRDQVDGFIVPERDAPALAARIDLLVRDRALRERMSTAARERAREFTWDEYGRRLVAAILSAAERRAA